MPAFYPRPQTIDEIINHGVGRILDLFDIEVGVVVRWREETTAAPKPVAPVVAIADSSANRRAR